MNEDVAFVCGNCSQMLSQAELLYGDGLCARCWFAFISQSRPTMRLKKKPETQSKEAEV